MSHFFYKKKYPVLDISLDEIINSDYVMEMEVFKLIKDGKVSVIETVGELHRRLAEEKYVIKVERIEHMNKKCYEYANLLKDMRKHNGPVTIHMFISPKGALSFPLHIDFDDVLLITLQGNKYFKVEDKEYVLNKENQLYIPHHVPHQAINKEASVMLSVGFESFLLDKENTCGMENDLS